MKVQELVEFVSNSKNKLLKQAQLEEVIAKHIETKKYLSIKQKKELVESIVNECILYEDGVYKFDDIDKYICFTMRVIAAYTNLELSDDIEDDYDVLCEAGVLDVVINTFKKEYDEVNILLQMKCDYVLSSNSLEAQVGKLFDGVLEKLDIITQALANKVEGFDINNLPISGDDLSKLMQLLNMQQ